MRSVIQNLQPDVPYRVRQLLGPGFTRLGRTLGQPEYRLRDTEYVGTVQQPLDEFTETLRDNGFEWDPLAWYHQPSVGSDPNGSWTYRRTTLADRQLHVILIAHSPEYIDVFAHDEYNWVRHPIRHLRQVGIEREAGRSEMRRWVRSHGIELDVNSRHRRQVTDAVRDLRKYVGSIVR
ncbi:hypothetical protein [Halobacterium rubrum]|uniref:hypothetical protein n=1 Tax=Halobacterium TaxID=2239 RepID=UPI001F347136|nr:MULTISPECIES: hypothetical protein [Halobacterium]MDH5020778.1 hypothetical protein [Halobacterium rubrum]